MPLKSLIEMNTPSFNGSIIIQGMIEASTRGMHFPWDNIHLVKKFLTFQYRICDISHMRYISQVRYIAYGIYRTCDIENQKNKIKQRLQAPQISFSKHRDSEKPQERNSASAICVLPFRGRGGLLQWQVNASSILFI